MSHDIERQQAEESLARAVAAEQPYTLGRDMLYALHRAGLLPQWPMVSRVIIDIEPRSTVQMYVEVIASNQILNLGFDGSRWNVEVLDKLPDVGE